MRTKSLVTLNAREVEAARMKLLLTPREVMQRAGCGYSTWWKATRGQSIGIPSARRIAAALRVPLRSLIEATPDSAMPLAAAS